MILESNLFQWIAHLERQAQQMYERGITTIGYCQLTFVQKWKKFQTTIMNKPFETDAMACQQCMLCMLCSSCVVLVIPLVDSCPWRK